VTRGGAPDAHIEFDGALELDDGFGMMAIFEQRIADGLPAVDEQAWTTQLPRLSRPINTMVDAELHDGGSTSFTLIFLLVPSNA
jgi:hypothetical protein